MMRPNPIGENGILKQLGADDLAALQPHLKSFTMVRGAVLHLPGGLIQHVYFPLSGMVSILAVMKTGEQIETAIIGREGVVGSSVGTYGKSAFGQATVQIPGSAWQIQADRFVRLFDENACVRQATIQFQGVIFLQAQQSAACHALHTVESRLCRWLLQSRDLLESDTIELTQEFLSHMLGVQRNAVSLAAAALQKRGLIEYLRGTITILDRNSLEGCACECYEVIREHLVRATTPRKKGC
jgi:CRP-like cAMP-binding protein